MLTGTVLVPCGVVERVERDLEVAAPIIFRYRKIMGAATSRSRSTRSTTPHGTRTVPVNMHAGEFSPAEDGRPRLPQDPPLNKFQWSQAHVARPERTIDMQTRSLTERLSVSSQLTLTDLTAVADQGIRSII